MKLDQEQAYRTEMDNLLELPEQIQSLEHNLKTNNNSFASLSTKLEDLQQ